MSTDVYERLAEFLDKMPGRFPKTDSGVEIKILKKLFTPEQAEIAMKLQPMPETVEAIAKRLGMSESEAAEKLERMAKEGSIYRIRSPNRVMYMAMQFIVGIYEFHLNSIDRELAEMMEEYLPVYGLTWKKGRTQQLRVVPVGSSIESKTSVAPYNLIKEMLKQQEIVCVSPCICRKEKSLLGERCDRPQDLCFQFGLAARYYIENGMGRQISVEEASKLLDLAEESALVLNGSNSQDLMSVCCCCKCCCGVLRSLNKFDRPADFAHSYYQAKIDPELCSACGTCVERCQIDAIIEGDEVNKINTARCIGCGLCVSTCPSEAISLVQKTDVEAPPKNIVEMMIKMSKERGLV